MKLFGAGNIGQELPCAVDGNGIARDVSALIGDFTPDTVGEIAARLGGVDLTALPAVDLKGVRIGPPISQPRNIWHRPELFRPRGRGGPAGPGRADPVQQILGHLLRPERPDPVFPPDDQAGLGGGTGRRHQRVLDVAPERALDHVLGLYRRQRRL